MLVVVHRSTALSNSAVTLRIFLPHLQMQRDSFRKPLNVVVCLGVTLLVLMAWLYSQAWAETADVSSCKAVYMYPSYARIKSFDESHTKFASKYSLYIYREQGKDPVPEAESKGFEILDGIPVLFVPGNAGSFRQVRSIAAEAANLYYDENINVVDNPNTKNLDFFAADFNEDFTAFHGRTLLDQAEYLNEAIHFIILLYAHTRNPPQSVLIIAHSMGGIVARVLPTLGNYIPGSINTIVSLASPHSVPPLTFDGDILQLYLTIDSYWYRAFNDETFSHYGALNDISLISITGGLADSVLPADYTTLGYLIPPTNGFTAYTTGIPGVWTPMDHLAIVWCRQLRRTILKALLEVVDFTSPSRAYSLEKRMAIFKKNFLSGFEDFYLQDILEKSRLDVTSFKIDAQEVAVHSGLHATWKSSESKSKKINFNLLSLNNDSSVLMIRGGEKPGYNNQIEVYLCSNKGTSNVSILYTTKSTSEFLELFCVDILSELHTIPRSARGSRTLEESAFDGEYQPYQALFYNRNQTKDFDSLLVIEKRTKHPKSEFAIVLTSDREASEITINNSLWSIILRGAETTLLHDRGLAVNVNFPGVWSSILAYEVRVRGDNGRLFEPFIRQWLSEPFETKWITNLRGDKSVTISMHGIAPFTPFNTEKEASGLNLQFWADPKEGFSKENLTSMELNLSINWTKSLKLLVVRFRLAAVSHCLAVTLLVMAFQLQRYSSTGKFPEYFYGLSKITEPSTFIPIMLILFLLTPATQINFLHKLLDFLDPVHLRIPLNYEATYGSKYKTNSLYLGIEELPLSILGCLFFIMAIGANYFISFLLASAGKLIESIMTYASSFFAKNDPANGKEKNLSSSYSKRKLFASAALLLMIPFYLPYQFAYVVCFVIQTLSCIKILWKGSLRSWWNYNFSILMIMLWVLPINVPILIVFVHNFNLSWTTPFSSHHNFLAVAPILVLIELHNFYGDVIPLGFQTRDKQPRLSILSVTIMILAYTIIYSIVYGIRHAFWLHHLFNFWCGWLVVVCVSQNLGHEK